MAALAMMPPVSWFRGAPWGSFAAISYLDEDARLTMKLGERDGSSRLLCAASGLPKDERAVIILGLISPGDDRVLGRADARRPRREKSLGRKQPRSSATCCELPGSQCQETSSTKTGVSLSRATLKEFEGSVKLRGRGTITFHVFDPQSVQDILNSELVDAWRADDAEKAEERTRRAAWKRKLVRSQQPAGEPASDQGRCCGARRHPCFARAEEPPVVRRMIERPTNWLSAVRGPRTGLGPE